jgi:hypothetical protein
MIKISEKDLFNFVFYPNELIKDKYNFIAENFEIFSTELKMLKELHENLKIPLDESISKKLEEIINSHLENKEIILVKEQIRNEFKSNDFLLAAASTHIHQNKTETFIDAENRYLAKIIFNTVDNKLFVFSNHMSVNQNIKVKLLPSNTTLFCNLNDFPLSIPQTENVDQIVINLV